MVGLQEISKCDIKEKLPDAFSNTVKNIEEILSKSFEIDELE